MKYFLELVSKFDGKGIKTATTTVQKLNQKVKQTTSSFKAMGMVALKIGVAVFALKKMFNVLKSIADVGDVQRRAQISLAQAINTVGRSAENAQGDLESYAAELQQVTRFGDEAIIGVQAQLVRFGVWGQQLKELTALTLDFATAQGTDIKSAGDLLAKTIGSSTNALSRYGIVVEGAVGSTERAQSAIDSLRKLFGGLAAKDALTLSGVIKQLSNDFGDLKEKIETFLDSKAGKGMLNFFREIIKGTGQILDGIKDVTKETDNIRINAEKAEKRVSDLSKRLRELRLKRAGVTGAGFFNFIDKNQIKILDTNIKRIEKFLAKAKLDASNYRNAINSLDAGGNDTQPKSGGGFGFAQAFDLMDNNKEAKESQKDFYSGLGANAKDAFFDIADISNQAANSATQAFRGFFDDTNEEFLNFGNLVDGVFKGITDSFLDMVSTFAAKSAIFGLFNLVSGGAFSTAVKGFGSFLGFANGGNPPVGVPSIVGEKGPELFVPKSAGTIIPNNALGGSTVNVNPTINISGNADQSAIRQVTDAIRRGTVEGLELAKVSYKQGKSRSGETSL